MSGSLSSGPGGGIVPQGAAPVNPMIAGMAQRMTGMSTEQLQEYATRAGGSAQGQLAARVLQQRKMMPNAQPMPQQQGAPPQAAPPQAPSAPAGGNTMQPSSGITQTQQATGAGVTLPPTTNAMKRGGGIETKRPHFDLGGVPTGEQDPWWTRKEAGDSGLIHAYSPGRTDTMNMEPLAGSYIMPADVISGLGEGNTLAGSAVMDRILSSGPHGTQMPRGEHGRGPPAPPRISNRQFESRGGAQGESADGQRVPIVVAGGEYKVSPQQAQALGARFLARTGKPSSDPKVCLKTGHDLLDAFVLEIRASTIKDLKKLPPPKKK